jgi:hypothetical protein
MYWRRVYESLPTFFLSLSLSYLPAACISRRQQYFNIKRYEFLLNHPHSIAVKLIVKSTIMKKKIAFE